MTHYLRLSDGVFGLTAQLVRGELTDVSFVDGADLTEAGYAPYDDSPRPTLGANQQAVEVAPVAGVQQWSVVDVAPPVPVEVWMYQAKTVMVLTTLGSLGIDTSPFGVGPSGSLYDAVLAAIAALPAQARQVAMIQLDGAPGCRRDAPLLTVLAQALGLSDETIDNLFIAAVQIP